MNKLPILAALLLTAPLALSAQTSATSPPPGAVVTETTEDLDPVSGKPIRRTTRTYTVPGNATSSEVNRTTTAPAASTSATPARPAPTRTVPTSTASAADDATSARATDAQISTFLRRKTSVATLNGPGLLDAYNRFSQRVETDRHNWKPADWVTAAAVLSSLNARYEQLRPTLSLDDKVTIRAQQAEFQGLRTARQISNQVSDKL
jgi:hypothetical protein